MEDLSKNNKDPNDKPSMENRIRVIQALNEERLLRAEAIIEENKELIDEFQNLLKEANAEKNNANKSGHTKNAEHNKSDNEVRLSTESNEIEKTLSKLQKEKKALDNMYSDINFDIELKKREIRELSEKIDQARKSLKSIDQEILDKMDFIKFLEDQFKSK